MIHCPKCNATLPDFVAQCQFCGTAFSNQNLPPKVRAAGGWVDTGQPKWVWPAYYAIAGWWVLTGAIGIVEGVAPSGGGGTLGMVFGLIDVVFGVGLIARIEQIRGIANILCFINIVFGVLGFIGSFLLTAAFGWLAALGMVRSVIDVGTAVFLMFLIGETETGAPDL